MSPEPDTSCGTSIDGEAADVSPDETPAPILVAPAVDGFEAAETSPAEILDPIEVAPAVETLAAGGGGAACGVVEPLGSGTELFGVGAPVEEPTSESSPCSPWRKALRSAWFSPAREPSSPDELSALPEPEPDAPPASSPEAGELADAPDGDAASDEDERERYHR